MTIPDSVELATGIHKVVFPIALIFSIWSSRRAINHKDYPEAIWWAWTTLIIVLIG